MANSIGRVGYDAYCTKQGWRALNGVTLHLWEDNPREDIKAAWDVAGVASILYALDLMTAAGVTPAEAAAQLRAGKTIEDICAESSSYSARQICHADEAVLFPGSGPICTEPQGHEGAHVARDGSGRVVSSWASRG